MFSFFGNNDGNSTAPPSTNATGHQLLPTTSSSPPPSSASSSSSAGGGFASFFSRSSDTRSSSGAEVELSDIEDGSASTAATARSSSFRSFFDRADDDSDLPTSSASSSAAPSSLSRFSSFRTILGASSPSDSDARAPSDDEDSRSSGDLSQRLSGVVDSMRGYITGQPVAPPPVDNSFKGRVQRKCSDLSERFGCASMSYTQRIIGFGICVACGIACGIGAVSLMLFPYTFGLLYTLCIMFFLIGTFFLAGPIEQLKSMLDPNRIVASLIFVGSLVGTLLVAILIGSTLLVLLMIAIQTCSLIWYVASYIPFAREALWNAVSGLLGLCRRSVTD